jgi:pimeloyl-ACP methyl ester carboxylesterase
MIYLLSFREPGRNVGGPVFPGRIETRRPLFYQGEGLPPVPLGRTEDLETETRLVFLIHGYNVRGSTGEFNLLTLAQKLQLDPSWGIVCVLWPGDHWTRFASYPFEGDDADDTGLELAKFIDLHVARSARVHLITHSLGARVGLEALLHLRRYGWPAGRIGQVCLTAAAVDDYSLGYPGAYLPAVPRTDRVAVLASKKDNVLLAAYPVGELIQNFLFFWRETYGLALGYHGPKNLPKGAATTPANVFPKQIPKTRKVGHGDYIGYLDGGDPDHQTQLDNARAFMRSCLLDPSNDPVYP